MNYIPRKLVNLNGQDFLLPTLDAEFHLERAVYLIGEITDEKAAAVCSALHCLAQDSAENITLYIHSPGGSVTAGFHIYDTMRNLDCDVRTVACGMAASMAAFLLAAGTKGKRCVQTNAVVMIHQPLGGFSGQASDIHIHARHILDVRSKLNTILAQHSGQPLSRIEQDTERDYYMNADEAVAYGLADHVA